MEWKHLGVNAIAYFKVISQALPEETDDMEAFGSKCHGLL
jgi:hypothetical protein